MTMPAFAPFRMIDDARATPSAALLVPAPPAVSHRRATFRLETVLRKACPPEFAVLAVGLGIDCGDRRTCHVPDLMVTRVEAMDGDGDVVPAAEVLAVIEVMSLSNPLPGLLLRGRDYAFAGVGQFWILDSRNHTLTVHTEPQADGYRTVTLATAGRPFSTGEPFAVTVDPGLIG